MASTFRVTGILAGDGSGWRNTLAQGESQARRFGSTVTRSLGAQLATVFSAAALTQLARKTIEFGDSIKNMSTRLGVGVEWLQETGYAAKQAGSSMESLQKLMVQIARNREAALEGGSTGARKLGAFAAFGISEADLRGNNLEKLFDMIAASFKTKSQQTLLPAMLEVGGRGGSEMIQAFIQGLDSGREEARSRGLVMSQETVETLKKISDAFTLLQTKLIVEFAPAVIQAAKAVLIAGAQLRGAAAFWGAKTANITAKEALTALGPAGLLTNPKGAVSLVKKLLGFDPNSAALNEEANSQFSKQMDELQAFLRGLGASTSGGVSGGGAAPFFNYATGGGSNRSKIYSDQLLSVGNFLGSARNVTVRLQQQQLDVAREMARTLKNIESNTDVDPVDDGGF